MQRLRSQRGSAVLMAVLSLMAIGGLGAATMAITSTKEESRAAGVGAEQAFALAQAGIEFAKNRIDLGANPAVQNFPMGEGSFTIAAVPNSGTIASTGIVGTAQKTLTLSTSFGSNCIDLDVSTAQSAGPNLVGMKIQKNCLTYATITDWTFAWTPNLGEKTDLLQVQGNQLYTLYNNAQGYASGTKIDATDYIINNNNTPINKVRFLANLTPGKAYDITMHFSDGSSLTKHFVDPIGNVDATPGYNIEADKSVAVDPNRAVTVTALCSEITYGANGPKVPVKAWLGTNKVYASLWNGAAIQGGETYATTAGTPTPKYTVKANAKYGSFNATYVSTNALQVKTLINGDAIPPLAGFGGQKPISACVQPYIDAQGKAKLDAEEVLLLFELGVNMSQDPNSTAADFQDLVVLLRVE